MVTKYKAPSDYSDPPCKGCQLVDTCKALGTSCVAFNRYASSGKYKDTDVGTLSECVKNRRVR